jgi:hypothetical protein
LQSGVWVDGQRRYNQLVKKDRLTLTRAFGREGWRTVGFMPGNRRDWSVGRSYYRYNRVYDRRNLGYRGPDFGLAPMPDQSTLLTLQRRELARRPRPPLFAEVDLISSHAPWTRIPPLIPWETVGDGSIYRRLPVEESSESALFSDPEQARAAYTRSLEYSLTSFFAFVRRYGHDRMVVVLVGDHQPASVVSGHGASHDVPVSVIAPDSQVMGQITRWRWRAQPVPDGVQRGLAPVNASPGRRSRKVLRVGHDRRRPLLPVHPPQVPLGVGEPHHRREYQDERHAVRDRDPSTGQVETDDLQKVDRDEHRDRGRHHRREEPHAQQEDEGYEQEREHEGPDDHRLRDPHRDRQVVARQDVVPPAKEELNACRATGHLTERVGRSRSDLTAARTCITRARIRSRTRQ